ncbi:sensor histidine kinase [Magnetospirillum gryphiswaldense]|nr:ATP-binding protein [Magnetospirillum gryphiswaldense]
MVRYAQLLEQRYKGRIDADADDFLGFIVDGGKHMTNLIHDLLAFSRTSRQLEPLKPLPAREAVAQALRNLEMVLDDAGAEVIVGDLPLVIADQTHLVSLFQNLIGNGLKYRAPDRKPVLSIKAERMSFDIWRFAVADNGIGIEPQYHEKIFEIFQRLDPGSNHEGTGIGLTMCRRIVHRFGGTIWVNSEPGTGTTFFFTLKDGSLEA